MEIKNEFDIPLPLDRAWDVLMDIPRIAPCMPGAELTEQTPDGAYKGKVSVKLGPVALSFAGMANFIEKDFDAKRAVAKAQGSDQKGRGGASATVNFNLSPSATGTKVNIVTDVALTGLVAQYGRGAGVIQGVASHLVGQFADNLRNSLGPVADESVIAVPADAQQSAASPAPQISTAPAKPISGFSLILRVLWLTIAGLFKGKPQPS